MLINKNRVRKMIHENGLKSSKTFLDALDQFVAMQIVGAMRETKKKKRVILRRDSIYHLVPIKGGSSEG